MAGNVSNILRNEQYMNDAASCVFSNLLNVVKRKRDHIWNVSKYTLQEESQLMETEPNSSKGFWEDSNFEIKPRKVIDRKKSVCGVSKNIKTERNPQNFENKSSIHSVSCNPNKITVAIEPEMSYQESDTSVNRTSISRNRMIQKSTVENEIYFEAESKDLNKKYEYRTKSMSMPDVFQKTKPTFLPGSVHERKHILLPDIFHKTKPISVPHSFHEAENITEIDQKNHMTFKRKGLEINYTSETTNKTIDVFQRNSTHESKLKDNGLKGISKNNEYETRSVNKQEDFQNWCLTRQTNYLCSPRKPRVSVLSNKSKDTIPFLLGTPTAYNKKMMDQDTAMHKPCKIEHVKEESFLDAISTVKQKVVDQDIKSLDQITSSKERKLQNSASESPKPKLVDEVTLNELSKIKSSYERKRQNSASESPNQKPKLVDQGTLNELGKIKSSHERKRQKGEFSKQNQTLVDQEINDRLGQIKTSKEERKQHNSANEFCSTKEGNRIIPRMCSGRETHSKKENSETSTDFVQTMLSVTIMKDEKCYEIMTEVRDLSRMKKNFPKFSEVIPDVDCEEKEFDFSADAIKSVLGFMFNPSYNFRAIQNEMLAVEILALTHAWEITKFQNAFHKYFLQNILTESNASKIYSLASHFNLNEIRDACKDFVKDGFSMKYRQKKCSVAVTTYAEPLEFCLPLDPAKEQLSESFNRTIENVILFESISGCFSIKGFQIQLNVDKSDKNINYSKLEIYYSAKNVTEKIEIREQKTQKHLGSAIFIYFSKNLVVKPNQKGIIEVYTNIKPCLCYTFQKDTLVENNSNGKFNMTLKSNHKIVNSDLKVFFIGKLLYHVKPSVAA